MVFSSTVFLFLFLPALLILYYLPSCSGVQKIDTGGGSRIWKNTVLLIFSIGFYAWGEPIFVFIMLASVIVNWLLALQIQNENNKKIWLILCIIYDVALLAVFKYASFISKNLAALTGNDKLILNIALPIGISFFTFQMMAYVFDIYYGRTRAQKNPFYVALYVSLFPQLIAGPIVRYTDVEHDMVHREESLTDFSIGIKRFVYGLGKKVLLANFMGQIADNFFNATAPISVVMAWIGAIAYTLQIYFDFSGYSDMAIGLGRMFGFHFLENFNYPYTAKNVSDFWKRWHISLTSWFRDYVYIPLGGNRVSQSRWVFNLFIVWALTGIWHGANYTFLLWGMIYFAVLLVERTTGFTKKLEKLSRVYTMSVVILAWVFFRADNITAGANYIGSMFGIGAAGFISQDLEPFISGIWLVFLISVIGVTPIIKKLFSALEEKNITWVEPIWLTLVFAASVLEVVSATYNPFIYFNF